MNDLLAPRPYRVFDKYNPNWCNQDRMQHVLFINHGQQLMNNLLVTRGYVSLNDVLEWLGFERTIRAGQQGWLRDPDPGEGDGYIDFGVWAEGFTRGKQWLHGELDVMVLRFNVDRTTISMPRRIKKQKLEGKL